MSCRPLSTLEPQERLELEEHLRRREALLRSLRPYQVKVLSIKYNVSKDAVRLLNLLIHGYHASDPIAVAKATARDLPIEAELP